MKPPTHPRIFISVAEQSADEHAAAFIRAFRQSHPTATFAGLAGPAMRSVGCDCFHDMTARSAMALAAFYRAPEALLLLNRLRGYLSDQRFDAAVLVDSPTLNLPIAKICRRFGTPVLYYIAPQTWAWAAWRNKRIRHRVNRLACIWPFEEQWFRSAGIPATYVGHPLFDHLLALRVDETRVAALRANASPVVAILPGSRRHVVHEVLPGQLAVAQSLAARFKRARFLVIAANDEIRELIGALARQSHRSLPIEILEGAADRAAAIRAADLVLVASGTVTLEVAYHATPMIVMYNASRWMYSLVGRWLISTKHLSIPNILAGRRIVPEFMPYYRSVDPIVATAVDLLSSPTALQRVRAELQELIKPIVKGGAAQNAAAELTTLLNASGQAAGRKVT
jgi:lipid-A-disaccharide synthase